MDTLLFAIGSVWSGIVASLLTVWLLSLARRRRESALYRQFIGDYTVHKLDGRQIPEETVTLSYHGNRLFQAESKQKGTLAWQSRITMNSTNHLFGEGVFEHRNREEYGVHAILISEADGVIRVHFRDLSKPGGPYGGVIWQPIVRSCIPDRPVNSLASTP